jgi:hypothetical protein
MTHDHQITVTPCPGGWRVSLDDLQPLMFLSGGKAEAHARDLAARLAELGDTARVLVHDRSSALAGVQLF